MEILFSAIARAGGVEIPADKRIFPAKPETLASLEKPARPSLLRRGLGRLFQRVGRRTLALGERLLGPQAQESWHYR